MTFLVDLDYSAPPSNLNNLTAVPFSFDTSYMPFIVPGEYFLTDSRGHFSHSLVDESEVRLVGDSMLCDQLREFCGRFSNGRRKHFCFSGGGLDDTSKYENTTLFVTQANTNDVYSCGYEELLAKYRRMIRQFKRDRHIGRRTLEITDMAISTATPVEVAVSKSIKLGHFTNKCHTVSGTRQSSQLRVSGQQVSFCKPNLRQRVSQKAQQKPSVHCTAVPEGLAIVCTRINRRLLHLSQIYRLRRAVVPLGQTFQRLK
ncbi:hypothetical protein E2C01_030736 [Portunus trituberculatus]|uniref:Uncharacterized protein n=1 Tax=Portunus trituberculatus TaxID=210409 RepID=A0A5B7ESQ5_PORTR|nr:hypothetical protein [Portunus trituberculatus]